jgi:hypothetical protein
MRADTFLNLPIETVDCGTLAPTYPDGFNGPGYLYCSWCAHYIRLVCHTKTGVSCSDCGQVLNIVTPLKQVDCSLLRRETSCGTPDTPHLA